MYPEWFYVCWYYPVSSHHLALDYRNNLLTDHTSALDFTGYSHTTVSDPFKMEDPVIMQLSQGRCKLLYSLIWSAVALCPKSLPQFYDLPPLSLTTVLLVIYSISIGLLLLIWHTRGTQTPTALFLECSYPKHHNGSFSSLWHIMGI